MWTESQRSTRRNSAVIPTQLDGCVLSKNEHNPTIMSLAINLARQWNYHLLTYSHGFTREILLQRASRTIRAYRSQQEMTPHLNLQGCSWAFRILRGGLPTTTTYLKLSLLPFVFRPRWRKTKEQKSDTMEDFTPSHHVTPDSIARLFLVCLDRSLTVADTPFIQTLKHLGFLAL
jgi:hypothetical protein